MASKLLRLLGHNKIYLPEYITKQALQQHTSHKVTHMDKLNNCLHLRLFIFSQKVK